MDTFKDVKLKELLTLDKIYEIKAIDDNIINLETKVSISTVQGLLKRTILAEEPDLMPGAFDLIIVDEAHRGYILDREMTEEEKLKIYWSSETMQEVVAGFSVDTSRQKSLAIIKEKLKQDKNT